MYEKFQELLDSKGVTAYKVAKATGVSTATLTSWKQGKYSPKREKLQKIADYFGVSIDYFNEEPDKINRINLNLSSFEMELILAYRKANKGIQSAIDKLLDIEYAKKEVAFI